MVSRRLFMWFPWKACSLVCVPSERYLPPGPQMVIGLAQLTLSPSRVCAGMGHWTLHLRGLFVMPHTPGGASCCREACAMESAI